MIGIYYIAVVVLWSWLTWRLLRMGWRLANRTTEWRRVRVVLSASLVVAWLAASFWYSGGRIYFYDWKVRQMCAMDGGVKVYETVTLSEDDYDRYAKINWVLPDKARAASDAPYYYESEKHYYRNGNPQVARTVRRLIRRADSKVLGELVRYGRAGGDLPGPWHGSYFYCPVSTGFETTIFAKEIRK